MENNKLIAEFMGFSTQSDAIDERTMAYYVGDIITNADNTNNENEDNVFHPDDMKFNSSWDWLMSVVEQIENFGYEFIIVESRCYVKHNTDHSIKELFHIETIGSKIDTTHKAVVEFISKYNNKELN